MLCSCERFGRLGFLYWTFLEAGDVGGSTTSFFKKLDFEIVSLCCGKETNT